MPQYAHFDHTASAPQPIIGWYDTDAFKYPSMPPAADLLAVTAAQWAARLSNPSGWAVQNGALVAYMPPEPARTLAQQAMAMLFAGLSVTSTGVPALNATYACDPQSISDIQAEVVSILLNGVFTNGTGTIEWPDTTGGWHAFTVAQFKALATALAAFVGALKPIIATSAGTLPSASATIA